MFLIWLSQTELKLRSTKNQTVAEQLAVLFQVSPVPLVFHSNKSTIRIHPENLQRCFRPFGTSSPKCSVLQSKTYSLVFGSIKPVCDCVLQEMASLRCEQSSLQQEQSALTQVASV